MGKERKVRFKTFHKLLGLVTYLDWVMICITTMTTISMMIETPQHRVMNHTYLQIMDYVFVIAMGGELTLKVGPPMNMNITNMFILCKFYLHCRYWLRAYYSLPRHW